MKGSLKRSLGKPFMDKNTRAYFGLERLPHCPDENSPGHLQCRAFKRSHQMCKKSFFEASEGSSDP
jgi:hypothetical protein